MSEEDLQLKIAKNPEQRFWIELKERCLKEIDNNKREIIINEEIVKLAEKKIDEA